jgi:hypothetical protein
VRGLALDSLPGYEAEYVYWADGWAGYIRRCGRDGTGQDDLVRKDFWTPSLIPVDRLEGKMYYSSSDDLRRANLDGPQHEVIYPDLIASAIALPECDCPFRRRALTMYSRTVHEMLTESHHFFTREADTSG